MAKQKLPSAKRIDEISMQPTIYTFNFKDVPADVYTEKLNLLFHDPNFAEAVEKRNKLVQSANRLRQNSPEMLSVIKAIQQRDRKLADLLFTSLVQTNLHSDVKCDFLSFSTLLKYYVDYSKPGIPEKVNRLSANLDKITFLSDMLEFVLVDIKYDMGLIFGNDVEFKQFDGVKQTLTQLRGFFKISRPNESESPEAQLYLNYADSINEYLEKRLKTYTEKYRKIHPIPKVYTVEDMQDALNQFFGTDNQFGLNLIKHTETGGAYIDAISLLFCLKPVQAQKLDKLVGTLNTKDTLNYCFAVTDAIMQRYKKPK